MEQKDSTPMHSLTARSLLRSATTASLGTNMVEGQNAYCSLVMVATDPAGCPLLLLSDLAVHSHNIAHSPQVSILINEPLDNIDPLTQPRATFQGRLAATHDDQLMRRYLRRYPSAERFAGFADFQLYRLIIERVHLISGFGEIHWIDGIKVIVPPHFLNIEESETDILDHMNTDHVSAIQTLAGNHGQIKGLQEWKIVGLDPEGFDLLSEWRYQRILFENSVSNANEVRQEFVRMVKNARN
ncbi:DUF2470 domain-containing protein [Sneathiella marina]|uniref:DUF2470 domain-containing protein n=1 Tax=Sneathiella marina TaxID=2950108 RepID=A0ABY4W2E3_9PROT|nr:DUF2470 domain-containing protein [Sneathiella marina]USG61341.1 DUF2470 domain-containing protein [Sneathiella marina]